jgi:hypothetical protein
LLRGLATSADKLLSGKFIDLVLSAFKKIQHRQPVADFSEAKSDKQERQIELPCQMDQMEIIYEPLCFQPKPASRGHLQQNKQQLHLHSK